MRDSNVLLKVLVLALAMTGVVSCQDDESGVTPPPVEAVEVGDPALKEQLLAHGVDADNDGYITAAELAAVRTLDLSHTSGPKITVITELAQLTSVEELTLDGNSIRSLAPIAGLKNLKRLSVRSNGAMAVGDLSGLESLEELDLSDNTLTGLVEQLENGNTINSLDLTNNLKLRKVTVNEESALDCIVVNALPRIESVEAVGCDLLLYVYAIDCPALRSIDVHGSGIFVMPWISGARALESLDCSDCSLYSTEYLAVFQQEYPALKRLLVSGNASVNDSGAADFREVDFSLLPALETLDVSGTRFAELDFSGNKQLRELRAENMPRLRQIDLRNDAYPQGADYRIVEGNAELKLILVDEGAETEAVLALVGTADITVANEPEGGDETTDFLPVPAPAVGSDENLSPSSVGNFMWYPPQVCGKKLSDVRLEETKKGGTLKEELTAQVGDFAVYYFAISPSSNPDIAYRSYWIGTDEKVAQIRSYVVSREKFLVKKEDAWIMNPNFKPSSLAPVESLGERDGAFWFKGGPYAVSFSYEFSIRAVLLGGKEYAEITYTLAE